MKCSISRRRPSPAWGGVAALAAAAAWAGTHLSGLLAMIELPACSFRALTGFPCAACGTTRAVSALLGGSIAAAASYQPLATVAALSGALGFVLFAAGRGAGMALQVDLSTDERTALRFGTLYLLAVNWLYLIGAGI